MNLRKITKCECGISFCAGNPHDEMRHKVWHQECFHGLCIPELCKLPSIAQIGDLRLTVVDNSIEEPIRRAVAEIAMVAQRSMPEYPAGYQGSDSEVDTRLFTLVKNSSAVGMVIISMENIYWHMSWNSEGEPQLHSAEVVERSGQKIARVWAAASYRRKKLATRLIENSANYLDCDFLDLGWEMPFTDSGNKLVRGMCGDKFWGCGDIPM